jgi:hypothetical protein
MRPWLPGTPETHPAATAPERARREGELCRLINKEIYLIEPLFYHSAIIYERRGAGYLMGREIMEEIQAGFSEGPLPSASPAPTPGCAAAAGPFTMASPAGNGAMSRCTRPPAVTPASTPSPAARTSRLPTLTLALSLPRGTERAE